MKLTFTLGEEKKTEVEIERNWFTGGFTYSKNGQQKAVRSALDAEPHFSMALRKKYAFEVQNEETYKIEIVHTKPLLFAGYRPHRYEIFVNGKLVKALKTY